MCAVCSIGYTYNFALDNCVPCGGGGALLNPFSVLLLIVVMLLVALAVHAIYTTRTNSSVRDLDDYQLFLLVKLRVVDLFDFDNHRKKLKDSLTKWQSQVEVAVKTHVTLYQVDYAVMCS